jgi:DNA-binding transcriptional ArsR family regulator
LLQLRRGPRAVNDLASEFELGRPAISEHLQVLRKAKLVREQPRGRERFYHLDPRPLSEVDTWLEAFTKYWNKRLAALEELLNEEDSK